MPRFLVFGLSGYVATIRMISMRMKAGIYVSSLKRNCAEKLKAKAFVSTINIGRMLCIVRTGGCNVWIGKTKKIIALLRPIISC